MKVMAPAWYAPWFAAVGIQVLPVPPAPLEQQASAALAAEAHLLWSPDPAEPAGSLRGWTNRLAAAGLLLCPAYHLRHLAPIARVVQLTRDGAAGPLAALRLRYHAPAGAMAPAVRVMHLSDLYACLTGVAAEDWFRFDGSPYYSGGAAIPASLDLADGPLAVQVEVIGRDGTLWADGYGQHVQSGEAPAFVGDPPEAALVASFLERIAKPAEE